MADEERTVPPVKIFRYFYAPGCARWTWTCWSCGMGRSQPQWTAWDTQPAALSAALRHCRESRLG